jgi:sulfate transport system substrate-binding protein
MIYRYASFAALVLGLGLLGGCGSAVESDGSKIDTLTVGAFSVTREVLHDGLIPAFRRQWEKSHGRSVHFEESYLASGALSRAVLGGFDADVALFSLEPDVEPLVKAGLVASDWNAGPAKGYVTRSLVVIGYRPGNPKSISDWKDLTKPEVSVLYADPKTSGGARWNLLAVAAGGYWPNGVKPTPKNMDADGAERLLADVQHNVTVMDPSGRQSLATFLRNSGDAAITYENDLVQCERLTGRPMPYVIPPRTLWIEIPAVEVVATTQRNGRGELAQAFLEFLRSDEATAIWAQFGFRPVHGDGQVDGLPPVPEGVATVAMMGGWKKAREEVFGNDGLWTRSFLKAREPAKTAASPDARGPQR